MFPNLAEYQIIDVGTESKQVTIAVCTQDTALGHNLMPLHNGSHHFVKKDDLLKIFTDKPALYSVRLAGLVFGEDTLRISRMPDENDTKYEPLDGDTLNSIISELIYLQDFLSINHTFHYSSRCPSFQAAKQSCLAWSSERIYQKANAWRPH